MTLRSTAKRWTYLVHRWLGIGGCLLMLLWFVSGMVMLFIGYPKLTPGERLAALPVLGDARDLQGLSVLPAVVQAEPEVVALTTLRGEPAYVVRNGSNVGAWSAVTGQALLPVVTVAGVNLGVLLTGTVVAETVFSWPGLGTLALEAILGRDYPTLLGVLTFSSLFVITANLLTDLSYRWIDPRLRGK